MSGEEHLFNIMTKQDLGSVIFSDNSKVRAVGIGSISFTGLTQVEQDEMNGMHYDEGNSRIYIQESYGHPLSGVSQHT